jgi:hypothetical protein
MYYFPSPHRHKFHEEPVNSGIKLFAPLIAPICHTHISRLLTAIKKEAAFSWSRPSTSAHYSVCLHIETQGG